MSGLVDRYNGDCDVAYRKHRGHNSPVRTPVGLPQSRRFVTLQ